MPATELAVRPKNLASWLVPALELACAAKRLSFSARRRKRFGDFVALDNASRFYKSLTFFV
jgi:hypothetical protein